MRIQRKISQHRRDFLAIFECEFCGETKERTGYDDTYFHREVIPSMTCPECGRTGFGPSSTPDVPTGVVL